LPLPERVPRPDESEFRIQELAELLIARRGEKAMTYARYEALKANRRGALKTSETWSRIADAAEQVWRVEPADAKEAPREAPAQVVLRRDRGLRRRLGFKRARSTT
jgi:hypothetical protein